DDAIRSDRTRRRIGRGRCSVSERNREHDGNRSRRRLRRTAFDLRRRRTSPNHALADNPIFWLLSGSVRTGLPVAANIALSTAGVTTEIVGSPTPPQKSIDGTTTVSTFGISTSLSISYVSKFVSTMRPLSTVHAPKNAALNPMTTEPSTCAAICAG